MAAELTNPSRFSGPTVRELREHYWSLMPKTRTAATEARRLLSGEMGITLPETVQLAGADAWLGDLPHKRTGPQRIRQKLIGKQWDIKRPVTGGGPRAQSVATRIEQPLHAIMKDEDAGFPWDDCNDLLLLEGLAFSTVTVDSADWRRTPTLYAENAPSLDVANMEDRFAVDGEGRFRGDDGYDAATVDGDKARREHTEEVRDHLARNLPFRQRAYSIRQVAPIWGSDFKLEGLIVETEWTAMSLRRKGIYVSKHKDGSDAQLYPLGALSEGDRTPGGAGRPVKVTEAWLLDDEHKPYLAYCVEGYDYAYKRKGNRGDGYEDYVVDLSRICKDGHGKWHGFSRLPVSWGSGLGWSSSDFDQRVMPFTAPFQQGWRNADALMTCIIMASMWLAMPALVEEVPFNVSGGDGIAEKASDTPDIQPLKITRVTGKITNVGGQGPNPVMLQALSLILGENKTEQPGGEQDGGASGFAQTISEALESDALTTVNKSAMKMASTNASLVLEAAKFLGECYQPVRVYQIADVLLEQKSPSDTDQQLVLEPGMVGSSFDVRAVAKKVPGENPAVRQQNAGLVKEGFYDKIWFLEEDGYSAPEEMAMRVQWQLLLESDQGQAATMRMLESYVTNKFVEQIQEAIAAEQANAQGLAMGAGDGTMPPPDMLQAGPQATGGMPGLGVPNPAAASLGAVVGAGLQTGPLNNVAQGGGELPPGFVGAPV